MRQIPLALAMLSLEHFVEAIADLTFVNAS